MNKSEIISISKPKSYDRITAMLSMSHEICIARMRALGSARCFVNEIFTAFYKRNCNNWRKIHCKPMKRRKQLKKVKGFY